MKAIIKSKKTKIAFAVIALMLIFAIGATMALLTITTQAVTNRFTVAKMSTEIEEEIEGMVKKPAVKNTGTSDCLVRMRYTVSPENLGNPPILTVEADGKGVWVLAEDGFYYYQGILKASQTTPQLELGVTVRDGVTIEELQDADITIYQESIQTIAADSEGNTISALVDGRYDSGNASKLWEIYDSASPENE